ncbi:MAG: KEOPS complex subunit Pcc1 [Candidatus Thermoplasmatota archaeon]|nr:KEOPS complex subunit Pcc1 [Candidatus Thermoplasmatota archaeon]
MDRGNEPFLTIEIRMGSPEEALRVFEAIRVDDDQHVMTSMDGEVIRALIKGPNIGSVRRASDDWMACLMAAVRIVER